MKKYSVSVKTIKYKDFEIPAIVTVDRRSYFISEVKKQRHHVVFPGGGVGTKYTVVINKKEKFIFLDQHTGEWHIYHEAGNEPKYQFEENPHAEITLAELEESH